MLRAMNSARQITPSILKFTPSSIPSQTCITLSRPKEAAKYIKQRLLKKNPRIQWLALTLLDGAMTNCKLQFHSQICTKDFMNGMITILNKSDVPEQISNKMLSLVQKWATDFQNQQDILPLFQTVYDQLKKRDYKFPNSSEPKTLEIKQKEAKEDIREDAHFSNPQASHAAVPTLLEGVYEAIMVANEIIDNHDPTESVKNNEALLIIIQQLQPLESKLQNIIEKNNSEEILDAALKLNEDLHQTKNRYTHLQRYTLPPKFTSSFSVQSTVSQPHQKKPLAEPKKSIKKQAPIQKVEEHVDHVDSSGFSLDNMLPAQNTHPNKPIPKPEKKIEEPPKSSVPLPNLLSFDDDKPVKSADPLAQTPLMPGETQNPLSKFSELMENMKKKEEAKAIEQQKKAANMPMYMYPTNMNPQINPMMFASMSYGMPNNMYQYGYGQQYTQPSTNSNVIKPAVRPQPVKEEQPEPPKKEKDDFDELFSLATNIYSQPITLSGNSSPPTKPETKHEEKKKAEQMFEIGDIPEAKPIDPQREDLIFGGSKKNEDKPLKADFDDLFSDVNGEDKTEKKKEDVLSLLL